jgi:hypothetical protein
VRKLYRRAAIATVAGAALTLAVVGTAYAAGTYTAFPDPSGKTINIEGSETLQDVLGALTDGYTWNGHTYTVDSYGKTVGSWNAVNPSTGATYDNITPVSGCDTFPRPNGSGDGRNAISAAWGTDQTFTENGSSVTLGTNATCRHEEISMARASSLPSYSYWTQAVGSSNNDLTQIPVAIDAVGVAEQTNGSATEDAAFTTADLQAVYNDSYTNNSAPYAVGEIVQSGGFPYFVAAVNKSGAITSEYQVVPVVPQSSSGTRSFFASALGINNSSLNKIVADESNTSTVTDISQEENNAAADLKTANVNAALSAYSAGYSVPANSIEIVPFSGAQAIEQEHGLKTSTLNGGTGQNAAVFPTINGDTLFTGTGVSAGLGTLQSAEAPDITYNDSDGKVVGDFDRYVWIALPSSEVTTAGPSSEVNPQKWVDQTIPVATNSSGGGTPWGDFGFKTITTSVSDNPSNWITFAWTNIAAP